jgi:hypothetical protein
LLLATHKLKALSAQADKRQNTHQPSTATNDKPTNSQLVFHHSVGIGSPDNEIGYRYTRSVIDISRPLITTATN